MPRLFGVDIAGEINKAMGSGLLPVTLEAPTEGTRTAGALSAGTNPTTATYTGRGFIDKNRKDFDFNTTIGQSRKTITVLGASISTDIEPKAGWKVTIEGLTYDVIVVKRDPAAATFELQVIGPV